MFVDAYTLLGNRSLASSRNMTWPGNAHSETKPGFHPAPSLHDSRLLAVVLEEIQMPQHINKD